MCSMRWRTPGAAPASRYASSASRTPRSPSACVVQREAARREVAHGVPIVRRVGPERRRARRPRCRPRTSQPVPESIDAVDEELRLPRAPAAAVLVAVRRRASPQSSSSVISGLIQNGMISRIARSPLRLELAQQVERLRVAVHPVRAGDADGGEARAAGSRSGGSAPRRSAPGSPRARGPSRPVSRSSPVGTPSTHTISACSSNAARPVDAGELQRRGVASAVWKSMNVSSAGLPPAASSISGRRCRTRRTRCSPARSRAPTRPARSGRAPRRRAGGPRPAR